LLTSRATSSTADVLPNTPSRGLLVVLVSLLLLHLLVVSSVSGAILDASSTSVLVKAISSGRVEALNTLLPHSLLDSAASALAALIVASTKSSSRLVSWTT
jgi:hypothetical protein